MSNLSVHSDEHEALLTIVFPARFVSTNTDQLREKLAEFFTSPEAKINQWKRLELDFRATEFIDSIGLNLVFDLVKGAEEREAEIVAWVVSRAVRLILYTVRLDKKMDIRLVETRDEADYPIGARPIA